MTDSFTKQPIKVSTHGDSGPYILVQLDQLDAVKRVLDEVGQPYDVDEYAISLDDSPMTVSIDLDRHADVEDVQRRLDQEVVHTRNATTPIAPNIADQEY